MKHKDIEYYIDYDPGVKSNPQVTCRTILVAMLIVEALVIGAFVVGIVLDVLS